jgi:hypothetical protein
MYYFFFNFETITNNNTAMFYRVWTVNIVDEIFTYLFISVYVEKIIILINIYICVCVFVYATEALERRIYYSSKE